jgi:hypothetical protein
MEFRPDRQIVIFLGQMNELRNGKKLHNEWFYVCCHDIASAVFVKMGIPCEGNSVIVGGEALGNAIYVLLKYEFQNLELSYHSW